MSYVTVIQLLGCVNVTCHHVLSRGATWSRAAPRVLRVARYTSMQQDKFVTREGLTCRLSLLCLRYIIISRSREYSVRDLNFQFRARVTPAVERKLKKMWHVRVWKKPGSYSEIRFLIIITLRVPTTST